MQIRLLIFSFLLCTCVTGRTQKKLNLTIVLDKSIDDKKIECSYYDGRYIVPITDTFTKRTLKVKDSFYSDFSSFHIEYKITSSISYVNDFFVNNLPSEIIIKYNPDNENKILEYNKIENATPIYDTSANEMFKKLTTYRKKEIEEVLQLWEKHGNEISRNDSLSLLNQQLVKALNISTVSFLKNYPKNYFSFWYFRTQVVEPSLIFLTKDTPFLKSLLDSLNTYFPKKFITSYEGQAMIKSLTKLIKPAIPEMYSPSVPSQL